MIAFAWISQLTDVSQAAAAVFVAWLAWTTFRAWKHQKKYDRYTDAASEIVFHLYELEGRISEVRSPMETYPAGLSQDEMRHAQWEKKAKGLNAVAAEFNSLTRAVAKMELWHDDFCAEDLHALKIQVIELQVTTQTYFESRFEREHDQELERQWRRLVWGTPDDEFGGVIKTHAGNVRNACKQLVR